MSKYQKIKILTNKSFVKHQIVRQKKQIFMEKLFFVKNHSYKIKKKTAVCSVKETPLNCVKKYQFRESFLEKYAEIIRMKYYGAYIQNIY